MTSKKFVNPRLVFPRYQKFLWVYVCSEDFNVDHDNYEENILPNYKHTHTYNKTNLNIFWLVGILNYSKYYSSQFSDE